MTSGRATPEGLACDLLAEGRSPSEAVRVLTKHGHDLPVIAQALWVAFDYRGKRMIEEAIFESGLWPQWKGLEGWDDTGR